MTCPCIRAFFMLCNGLFIPVRFGNIALTNFIHNHMKTIKLENCVILLMILVGIYSFGVALFAASGMLEFIVSIYLGMVGVLGGLYLLTMKN